MNDPGKICYDNIQIGDKVRIAIEYDRRWFYRFDSDSLTRDKAFGRVDWYECEVVENYGTGWLIIARNCPINPAHFWRSEKYPDAWVSEIDRSEYIHAVVKR